MRTVVRQFRPEDAVAWEALVEKSLTGTFLHTRRFLSYHGERFRDLSVCLYDGGDLVGVLPAAVDPGHEGVVTSHPGATYGGVIHDGRLRGSRMIDAMRLVCEHYAGEGMQCLHYKAVPRIYHRVPAEDDLYALFRLGALRHRCDLAAVVDLGHRLPLSNRRKRGLKAALSAGIIVEETPGRFDDLWRVVEENLARKYRARPVHTLEEIRLLHSRFPDSIRIITARMDEEVVAGVVLFVTAVTMHAQYIGADERGLALHALDAVFDYAIALATRRAMRWFSFGTCNESDGQVLNDGLYAFKSEFGAGGVVHEFYQLTLNLIADTI